MKASGIVPKFGSENFHQLCDELAASDPDLALVIEAHGYPPMWNRPNSFETLVHIILEQQVSLASALAAMNKMREKLIDVTPANVLLLTDEELRDCYFSRQKAAYVRHLAQAISGGEVELPAMDNLPDETIRSTLTSLKGIGNWTTDIYLIFALQRPDVFPAGDLAVVNALKRLKGLPKDASREQVLEVAAGWQPYRTIATMLLWHYYLSAPVKTERKTVVKIV